jgi:hypothetical protein
MEEKLMPTTLSTTLRHICDKVPNSVNSQLIADFHQYMKDNGTSQRHQNNNLKAIIAFADFLGPNTSFYQVTKRDHKRMLTHTKKVLEYNGGSIAINPRFDRLITSLSTAVENGEGLLDKEATSYDDIFDAFRMSLQFYQ